MKIEDCLLLTYPTVKPCESIKSIEHRLKEKYYLVVQDEKNEFYGILNSSDILAHSGKLVIDCLTPKEIIQTDDSLFELVSKFEKSPSEALPVFKYGKYLGVLEKFHVIRKLKSRMGELQNESQISQKIKKAFLQNLSHEVKTPLNHILGFMGIINDLSDTEIDPNKEEFYSIIRKSSEQFLSVMNDLMELARIYSGDKVEIYNDKISIESIFSEIKANVEGRAILLGNRINISYHNPDKTRMIYSDYNKIKLIILRLINYAIKYVQKDDHVKFGYEFPERQKIRFYVRKVRKKNLGVMENNSQYPMVLCLSPEYSVLYQSDFSMELAQKMIELLGGTFAIEESGIDTVSVSFTISYNFPISKEICKQWKLS